MLTEAQRRERNEAIYGSDLPLILSDDSTRATVIAEKAGILEPKSLDDVPWIEAGNRLESTLVQWAADMSGLRFWTDNRTWVDPLFDRLRGHVDAISNDGVGLEIKVVGIGASSNWGAGGDDAPLSVYIQCQAYMAVTGLERWMVFALINSTDPRIYHLHRNDDAIALIRQAARTAWSEVELARSGEIDPIKEINPATPRGVAAANRLKRSIRSLSETPITLDPGMSELYQLRNSLSEKRREADAGIKQIDAKIALAMGNSAYGICADAFEVKRKKVDVKPSDGYSYIKTTLKEVK